MATGAARFTKRYTDQEKNALMRAVIIDGHTVAEAVRMARTGRLANVGAFNISAYYAYDLVKKNREAFELANPDALALAIDRELTNLAAKALREARRVAKDDPGNTEAIRRAAQTLAACKRAIADQTRPKTTRTRTDAVSNHGAEPDATAYTPQTADVLSTLLANATKPGSKPAPQGAGPGSLGDARK